MGQDEEDPIKYIKSTTIGSRIEFKLGDQLHNKHGPAVIWEDGYVEYWVNGKRHREDGPAMCFPGLLPEGVDDRSYYYLVDVQFSYDEWKAHVNHMATLTPEEKHNHLCYLQIKHAKEE